MSGSYRDLNVWQKSIDLVVRVYDLTRDFPGSEMYGLTSQLRRAAVSVPSNIAEGKRRRLTTVPQSYDLRLTPCFLQASKLVACARFSH